MIVNLSKDIEQRWKSVRLNPQLLLRSGRQRDDRGPRTTARSKDDRSNL